MTTINRAPAAQPAAGLPTACGRPSLFDGWRKVRQMSKDWLLERRIAAARLRLQGARGRLEQQCAWAEMAFLISQRSPQQVARMERKAGLL